MGLTISKSIRFLSIMGCTVCREPKIHEPQRLGLKTHQGAVAAPRSIRRSLTVNEDRHPSRISIKVYRQEIRRASGIGVQKCQSTDSVSRSTVNANRLTVS